MRDPFTIHRLDRVIEWLVIIVFFVGNLAIARYTLGWIKGFVFVGGLVFLLPLYLVNIWNKNRKAHEFSHSGLLFGLYVLFCAFTATMSDRSPMASEHAVNLMILFSTGVLLGFHIKTLEPREKESLMKKIVHVIFITGLLQALLGLAQFVFDEDTHGLYKTLVTGTLMNPNHYGGFLVLSIACGGFLFRENRADRWWRYLYIGALVVLVSALLLCRSRGAVLSMLLSGGVVISYYLYTVRFKDFPRSRRKILAVFATIALVLCAVFVLLDRSSSQGRIMKVIIGFSMVHDYPFTGIGYGRYVEMYPDYQTRFLDQEQNRRYIARANEDGTTNNQFLKIWIEEGMAGLSLFLLLVFLMLKGIFTPNYLGDHDPKNWLMAFLLLSILFHMLFDETLEFPVTAFLFPTLCAFVPERWIIHIHTDRLPAVIRKFMCTVIIAISLVLSTWCLMQYNAVRLTSMAKSFLSSGDFSNAAFFAKRALDSNHDYISAKIIFGRSKIGLGGMSESHIAEGISMLETVEQTNPSRDVYLALSVGYLKSLNFERAYEYARKAHLLLPMQTRPKVMLCLLNRLVAMEKGSFLPECEPTGDMESHPDSARIVSLMSLIADIRITDLSHAPQMFQLIDLIMLAH